MAENNTNFEYQGPFEGDEDDSEMVAARNAAENARNSAEARDEVAYQSAIKRELVSDVCENEFKGGTPFRDHPQWNGQPWNPSN